MDITDAIKKLEINKKYPDTVLSGFKTLDEFTGGFQKGNLYIIAGKSSMCKSALVLNITRNVTVSQNKGVLFFTLEQSSEKLCNRLLAIESEIELDKICSDKPLEAYEWAKIELEVNRLTEKPLYIDDEKITINKLANYAQRMVEEHGVKLIIVDDIHRLAIADELKKATATREQEVSHNVRELKALALELNLPIIAISQLNKGSDNKNPYASKKPILADLKDSGSIEDEADMIMLLYRPEKYGFTEDDWGMPTAGVVTVTIAKNRDGNTTAPDKGLKLKFIDKYVKFAEYEEDDFKSFGFDALPNSTFDADTPASIRLGSRMNDGGGSGGFPYSNFDEEPPF
ncbi:DnaB-like helicase C-terminal domain-containing protein [Pontibacter flavimaris]|uniref:SF4 helicase domain-containing protein n=1 Tax=Pontibacter flavimaris TaxID=1797110 RepID=A0A1Q5PBB8_9BACT|nr:DnaB-like helicase C-terminal domain-containing protein [Pontibacter flavimaris]OKL39525.1 hypothetical protein A3841_00820 [Pontibacter flavimaris]